MNRPLRSVLCIDDDPIILRILTVTLEMLGKFQVETAASGAAGIEAALARRPDLILMDVMMPAMDGPCTLRQLRQHPETADIPVMFATARVESRQMEEYVEQGASAVIQKPFNPMTLVSQIRDIWNGLGC